MEHSSGSIERRPTLVDSLFRAGGFLAILYLGGCCCATTRIETKDTRVFLPSFRAAQNLTGGREAPSHPQDGNAVELGYTQVRGSDNQSLAAGSPPVQLGGQTFSGPQELNNTFDFSMLDLSWRWRKFPGNRSTGIEVLVGLANPRLGLAVSSMSNQASHSFDTTGVHAGFGLIWRLDATTSVQGRFAFFLASTHEGVNEARHGELSIAKALADKLSLRAGYSAWNVYGQAQTGASDFRLIFSGPSLILELNFGP
jgi:hypothetical protein